MDQVAVSAVGEDADRDRDIARELVERARVDGVSLVGPNGLLRNLTKTVLETVLNVELDAYLGYAKGDFEGKVGTNERNGASAKTVRTDIGDVRVDVPRDREGTFTPQIVPKYSRRVEGFDEAIISLYGKGMTTGEIQAHLSDLYGANISRETISKITDKVIDELQAWQTRPLDRGRFLVIVVCILLC